MRLLNSEQRISLIGFVIKRREFNGGFLLLLCIFEKKMLNIPSYVEDLAYRYKMPKMVLKIEGKGNGIKTNIVNLGDVAKSLRVPTQYPLKYLGHEFGCISEYKNKTVETCILNGART